jgi:hypothetical protein
MVSSLCFEGGPACRPLAGGLVDRVLPARPKDESIRRDEATVALGAIFEVAGGADVTLSNVLITGGNGQAGAANLNRPHEDRGGGILVDELSTLTIKSSTVTNNSAAVLGGGIADYGTLSVDNSTVSDNYVLGTYGGGIAVFSGAPFSAPYSATLTVSDSTVSDNSALQNGGGITGVSSTVTLNNCSVTGNTS